MHYDLAADLPILVPKAVAWAKERSADVAAHGVRLPEHCITIARRVGVRKPEDIRVAMVPSLPLPDDPVLRQAALETGLLGPRMIGLTLGHSIYICHGYDSAELIAHECRHVYQYEQHGSIEAFLPVYLQQIVQFGYFDAPFEVDARNHQHLHAGPG